MKSIPLAFLSLALLSGCQSMLESSTGDMMTTYTVDHLTPYTLAQADPGMGCELAQSTGFLLLSYREVTDAPYKAAVTTLASAGACTEEVIWAAELRGLQAMRAGDGAGAQDARVAEKRAHALAAGRFYRAWLNLKKAFAGHDRDKAGCPVFEDDKYDTDRVAWLIGHLSGVQAVQHDRAAKGAVGVPTDVPLEVARGIGCLNNERWWGVPAALQAAVWTGVPGSGPEGVDPWKQLDEASAIGRETGVRLALAIHAQAAAAGGKEDRVRAQIKTFAAARAKTPALKRFQMLDVQAMLTVQSLSDRMWTRAKGHRTPFGELGAFWDEGGDEEPADDDLLDGLDEAPTAAPPAAPPKKTAE